MAHVSGCVLHDVEDAQRFLPSPRARQRAGESLVDALVALHAVDIDAVGLGQLSRGDGFLQRQLKRWSTQWEASGLDGLDGMQVLHSWLSNNCPDEESARVVHGDFRLGNAMLARDGTVVALLDWELCTLGDPLADLAYLLRSWDTPDARFGIDQVPSSASGFPTVDELADRYASGSGRSLKRLDYWMAFTAWRSAAILAGVYRRYVDGKMGRPPDDLELFRVEVETRMHQGLGFAHLGSGSAPG
jgi:aminoglycoside phosphotransferase (APT) family kinase protein